MTTKTEKPRVVSNGLKKGTASVSEAGLKGLFSPSSQMPQFSNLKVLSFLL